MSSVSCYQTGPVKSIFNFACDCGVCETTIEQELDISRLVNTDVLERSAVSNSNVNLVAIQQARQELAYFITKKFKSSRFASKVTTLTELTFVQVALLISNNTSYPTYLKEVICAVTKSSNSKEQNDYELSVATSLRSLLSTPITTATFKSIAQSFCNVTPIKPPPVV